MSAPFNTAWLPRLSSRVSPDGASEGSLNPLGLTSIADRMAQHVSPGFRERMAHPRYLTAIAAGAHLCRDYDEDQVAADGISPPWQVWEWHVVSSLTKAVRDERVDALPGVEKARTAQRKGLPLNRARYLKSASVAGFHGVYRTLCEHIGLTAEGGYTQLAGELLEVWQREEGIPGFLAGGAQGSDRSQHWRAAIAKAMKNGEAAWNWNDPKLVELGTHFMPANAGRKERAILHTLVLEGGVPGFKREMMECVRMAMEVADEWVTEKQVHQKIMLKRGPEALRPCIRAILAWEDFCATLFSAFDAVRLALSGHFHKMTLDELGTLPQAADGAKNIGCRLREAAEKIAEAGFPENLSERLLRDFGVFDHNRFSPKEFIDVLLQHHTAVQKAKPPLGKQPWMMTQPDGRICLYNARYALDDLPGYQHSYVHAYRFAPLYRFLSFLKPSA